MRYVPKDPPKPAAVEAARYIDGLPFDDVVAVARNLDPSAQAMVMAEWRLLVIRTVVSGVVLYEPVADGEWLVFRPDSEYLYSADDDQFCGEYEPAAAGLRRELKTMRARRA